MSHVSLRRGQQLPEQPARRRHWWRWVLGGLLALVILAPVIVRATEVRCAAWARMACGSPGTGSVAVTMWSRFRMVLSGVPR